MNRTRASRLCDSPRTVILSQRRVHPGAGFSSAYEFEDLLSEWLQAERYDIVWARNDPALARRRQGYQLSRRLSIAESVALKVLPPPVATVQGTVDVVIAIATNFFDLVGLEQIQGWRRATQRFCLVFEPWPVTLRVPAARLEPVSGFNRWGSSLHAGAAPVSELVGAPVTTIDVGVDVVRFAPPDPHRPRPHLMINVGRRRPETHNQLLNALGNERYDFDRGDPPTIQESRDHRERLAARYRDATFSMLESAKFDQPEVTEGHVEVPARYFEALGAGCIPVGVAPPATVAGSELVVPAQPPMEGMADALRMRSRDREWVEHQQAQSVRTAALHHDWIYRARQILNAIDQPETEAMTRRVDSLNKLADLRPQ